MNCRQVWENMEKIRSSSPLVHNITNFVVMNNTANALLAAGASPIMASEPDELEELLNLASVLVLNIGTLSRKQEKSLRMAAQIAARLNIPVVVDPVGAGASCLRTSVAKELCLLSGEKLILRGNASEIMALSEEKVEIRGVDSVNTTEAAVDCAKILAQSLSCVVVVSGEKDFITDGLTHYMVHGGNAMMGKVTGMGCTASCIVAAHAAVASNLLDGAVCGMAVMAAAGHIASMGCSGPGSLQVRFLDILYSLSLCDIEKHMRIEKF